VKTQADKTQQNTSKAIANNSPKQQGEGESVSKFENNRTDAMQMRSLREMVNNSPQVKQLKAYQGMANNNSQVAQLVDIDPKVLERINNNFKESAIRFLSEIHELNPSKSVITKAVNLTLKMKNSYTALEDRTKAMDELRSLKEALAVSGKDANRKRAIIEDAGELEKNIINACDKFPNDLFYRLKLSNKILLAQIRDENSSPALMEKNLIDLQAIWEDLKPNTELLIELYPQLDSIITAYGWKTHKYSNDQRKPVILILQPLGQEFATLQQQWNEFKEEIGEHSMKNTLGKKLAELKQYLKEANKALANALPKLEKASA